MALTNPKYARQPTLGGFNAAGADASNAYPVLRVPNDPEAQALGAQAGTHTSDPTTAISDRFSASFSGGGSEQPIPDIPAQEALPSALSSDDIAKTFQPLFAEIESQKGPPGRPLPPPTPALATFLSVLAGTLGAQMAKDPRVEENIISTLNQNEQRRQAIDDQNYANDLMFNQQKSARRLAATGQMLEAEMEAAVKANDSDRMMKIQGNMEKLRGFMEQRNIMLTGREQRKTAKVVGEMKSETGGEAAATLEPKDYVARRGELLTSKETPESKGGFLGFGQSHPQAEALAQLDKEALHSGNEKTVAAAKRNIQQSVLKSIGIPMKNAYNRAESVAIQRTLEKIYGLSMEEVWDIGAPEAKVP